MTKNKKSFADLARELTKKYSRASFDSIEAQELEEEMIKLQERQEAFRESMGLNEQPQEQFAVGGEIKSWNDYIGGMPDIYDRIINPGLKELPDTSDVSTNAVKEYIGGLPNIYDRILIKPMQPVPGNKLVSTPNNEFLYSSGAGSMPVNPANIPPKTIVPKPKSSTVIKQPLVTPEYMTPEQSAVGIETDIRNFNIPSMSPIISRGQLSSVNTSSLNPMKTLSESEVTNLNSKLAKSKGLGFNLRKGLQNIGASENLPYLLSGASNIVGNLLLANAAKKIPQVQPVYATPEKINLEPKANVLRQQADVSKNVNMMNARNLGLNPGATLGSMGVINSGVDRGLSDALTNLYLGQEQANVGAANQFVLQNQDAANRVNSFNAGLKYQGLQDKLGYLGAALGTIPGVMKDIRADKADNEMRAVMDSYYKSLGGRNYMSVGSIFDTSFGKYKVKGYNPDGTPITEKVK